MISQDEIKKYQEENLLLKAQIENSPEKQWSSYTLKGQKGQGCLLS
jgi:phage terminase large subunit-like protein